MSGEFISGRPQGIRCLAEEGFKALGIFRLVHDGSEGGSRYYTKIYQLFTTSIEHPEGEYLDTRLTFRYDLRNNWADVSMTRQGITDLEKIWANLNKERELCQQEQYGQPSDSIAL